jgi:Protein of unknown function (DUF3667)
MENNNTTCKNCDKEFNEEFEFCPYCGQKAKDSLTMSVLFYNTISNYFSFDARFLKSFFPLLFRPGYLPNKFVEGRRLLYLHPAQFYLFVSVIFFFLFSFQTREYTSQADKALKKGFEGESVIKMDSISKKSLDSVKTEVLSQTLETNKIYTGMDAGELKELDSIINNSAKYDDSYNFDLMFNKSEVDSLIKAGATDEIILKAMGMKEDAGFFKRRFYSQLLKFQKKSGGGILQAFFDSIPIALFFLLPIFAFILKLFFWRRGSFSHHLVFSFYYFSFIFVVFSIIMLANLFWEIPDWIDWILALSTFFYLIIAVKQFYRQGYFLSFIKTGLVSFFYFMFVLPIALIIMVTASFFYY